MNLSHLVIVDPLATQAAVLAALKDGLDTFYPVPVIDRDKHFVAFADRNTEVPLVIFERRQAKWVVTWIEGVELREPILVNNTELLLMVEDADDEIEGEVTT